jgi:uncharacterized membrane protein
VPDSRLLRTATDRPNDVLLTRFDAAALVPVLQGRQPLLVHVNRASDIVNVLALKREFPNLRLVLVGAGEGWLVADRIAAARVPVIATALTNLPESFERLAATQSNIGRMAAAGVLVGIGMINDDEARQVRLTTQLAGNLVALTRVRRFGENGFRGVYSLVALVTFAAMVSAYRVAGDQSPLWNAADFVWIAAGLVMWVASILFVGSFVGNPALPGAARVQRPGGVLRITRHPMMWAFALWAIVHAAVIATPKALLLDAAILILALGGSAAQDRKKRELMGETWHEWSAQTAFWPFARGLGSPGAFALIGGTLVFLLATWLHPLPVGLWRWIG